MRRLPKIIENPRGVVVVLCRCGLVKQHELPLLCERAGENDPLTLAAVHLSAGSMDNCIPSTIFGMDVFETLSYLRMLLELHINNIFFRKIDKFDEFSRI